MAARWLAPALTLLVWALAAGSLPAEDNDFGFEFSNDAVKGDDKLTNLEIRPNIGHSYYLFVRNKSNDSHDLTVQIVTADGRQVLAESKFKLPQTAANKLNPTAVRVALAKVAPPPPPAGAVTPVAATAPAPMPMIPPPPPGAELKLAASVEAAKPNFVFLVRVFDERDKEKPSQKDQRFVIDILQPTDYVKPDAVSFQRSKDKVTQKDQNLLLATFKAEAEKFKGLTPCPVELTFPPQQAVNVKALREGVFRRSLSASNRTAKLYAKDMPVTGSPEKGEFHINIDGVPRAYVYRHLFNDTEGKDATVDQLPDAVIRFAEVDQLAPPATVLMTRPRVLPLRIEVDTSLADAAIELRIKQLPRGDIVETLARDEKRERHAYLDAGTMDGGVLVTTRVGDWTIPVDLKDLRGRYTLEAAIKNPEAGKEPLAKFERMLIVDDTKPEEVKLEVLPAGIKEKDGTIRHLRTRPVPVRITVDDPESGISKVVVFFGKVGPDGKLPEAYVFAKRPNEKLSPDLWEVMLPLPVEPPAPPVIPGAPPIPPAPPKTPDVTVVAFNGVDIPSEPVSVKIQLIDPPTGGIIKGKVALSSVGKGLPGVTVLLINPDNKEVGSAKTDDKGKFIMENVAPGAYKLRASRPDSGIGTKGEASVRVEAGKVIEKKDEVMLILSRKP